VLYFCRVYKKVQSSAPAQKDHARKKVTVRNPDQMMTAFAKGNSRQILIFQIISFNVYQMRFITEKTTITVLASQLSLLGE
jgi:hypothetical protein